MAAGGSASCAIGGCFQWMSSSCICWDVTANSSRSSEIGGQYYNSDRDAIAALKNTTKLRSDCEDLVEIVSLYTRRIGYPVPFIVLARRIGIRERLGRSGEGCPPLLPAV